MPRARNPSNQVEANPGEKPNASAQRRGPRGYFQGSRKAFLESKVPDYIASGRGNRQVFWHELYRDWWERYPWKLDDSQEPPTDDPVEMAKLALIMPGDEPEKALVETTLSGRLRQWFSNRAAAANSGPQRDDLAWTPLLQQLHQSRNTRPRQRTAVQQFMRDYADEVKAAFTAKYGDGKNLSNAQRMNNQHAIAKSLLYEKYSHLVSELEERAKAQNVTGVKEWNMILEDISLAENVAQARETLFDAVFPLLHAIGSYAGCYVSLIAGNPAGPTDEGFFTAVHWWPGDRSSTKSWTQWDKEGFNSGVAGPFLAYARETSESLTEASGEFPSTTLTPQVSPPVTLPNATPISSNSLSGNGTRVRPPATTHHQRKSQQLPTRSSIARELTKKRKHTSTSTPPTRPSEDSESEEESNNSGDGSSSGDDLPPEATKRQKTSRISTRSSTRTHRMGGVSGLTSSALPVAGPSPVNPGAGTPVHNTDIAAPAVTIPSDPPRPQSVDAVDNAMDADTPPSADAPPLNARDTTITETETSDGSGTGEPDITGAQDTEEPADVDAEDTTATNTVTRSLPVNDIDTADIPTFLLCHGTGKRTVNIFEYLRQLEDPCYQQVLFHYLRFEINDKSKAKPVLPATERPVEISQWMARARPAGVPDFEKGGRTFTDFVDSVFAWWTFLQPPWRKFERGRVRREVGGEWGILYAPRANGLLSIVVLVYWWAKVLEEQKPVDGLRADYELFAEDVAWVISNLYN